MDGKAKKKLAAFSLIELSIVIIMIALASITISHLLGLSKGAELRSVIRDVEEIESSYRIFHRSFAGKPGDIANATDFFAYCAVGGVGDANCNGNSDGRILFGENNKFNDNPNGDELVKVFRHLYLSGIYHKVNNTTLPHDYNNFMLTGHPDFFAESKVAGGALLIADKHSNGMIFSNGNSNVTSSFNASDTAIYLMSNTLIKPAGNGVINPAFAYLIDKKIDDGQIAIAGAIGGNTGKIRTLNDVSNADLCVKDAFYMIKNDKKNCIIGFGISK